MKISEVKKWLKLSSFKINRTKKEKIYFGVETDLNERWTHI